MRSRHIEYLKNTALQTVGDINGDDEPITFEIYCGLAKPKPKLAPSRYSYMQIAQTYRIKYYYGNRIRSMLIKSTTEQRAKDYFIAKYKSRKFISAKLEL